MFAKRFFQKATTKQPPPQAMLTSKDIDPRIALHYGIPSTASILAFDSIQSLLAVGTLDGRIKVIGGDNIEGLLVSPKQLPFKNLEFLQNQGFLVSVSNENEIQVWDLESRRIASTLQWESNITAFAIIHSTSYMYVGDEYGMVSVLKYEAEEGKLAHMPYYVPTNVIAEVAGVSSSNLHSVVGLLPQPCSQGNRLLIAYEDGLIIIWDVSEDQVVLVRGNKDLLLKDEKVTELVNKERLEVSDCVFDHEELEKEISSLCWASNDGSLLAVGYVDGDIMFWNLSMAASNRGQQAEKPSNAVVKLQLSSDNRRLPVIVLRGSTNGVHHAHGCQLFVYGGDAIGSDEVLTILSLDWSSGIESLKCVGRVDLTLYGSFADLVLVPNGGLMDSNGTSLLVLTNPGQLHVYDDAHLSDLMSQQQKVTSVSSAQYPVVIPTVEPYLTVGKLCFIHRDGKSSKAFSEMVSTRIFTSPQKLTTGKTKWPITGGVPSHLFDTEGYHVERIYVAGYQDGSVRIWDATNTTFSLIFVLPSEVQGIKTADANQAVSALDFCSSSLNLAVGNECGMLRLYKLTGSLDETRLKVVAETNEEVHVLPPENGPHCTTVFSLLNSPVCTMQFLNVGARLAVGFKCGRVAVFDIGTSSLLFITGSVSESSSPISSLVGKSFYDTSTVPNSLMEAKSQSPNDPSKSIAFVMTKDAHVFILESTTGNKFCSQSIFLKKESTAVSIHVIEGGNLISEMSREKLSLDSSQINEANAKPAQSSGPLGSISLEGGHETSVETGYFEERLMNLLILLCCEDALCLYSLKSLIQGDSNSMRQVNLSKPCCWTATLEKDDKECGLVLIYQTGFVEIRSLLTLDVVGEISLMSIVRWNFKTNMEKSMCSSNNGQIFLINGCEFAIISLLAWENDFRIPESLPSLYDKVLAAAADAAFSSSTSQKKRQDGASRTLIGILKGFKEGEEEQNLDFSDVCKKNFSHLEGIFTSPPFLKPLKDISDDQEVVELNIDDIDIDIDGPLIVSSSQMTKNDKIDKGTEREQLFEGVTTEKEPKVRTVEEIRAKYRKSEDASAAASRAKDKLVERQEKLERLSQRTEELQSGAESFASMANELAKRMEKRKWWNF